MERCGVRALAVRCDTGNAADIARMYAEVDARLGVLTHLLNNAGITGHAARMADVDPEMLRRVVDVNVTGAMLVAREAVRRMSTAHKGAGGAIVNLGSMGAVLGLPGEHVWYAASKGAITSFTVGLAREVAREGIRVNAVSPGLIDTEIHASGGQPDRLQRLQSAIPMGRPGSAEEVAASILYLLSDQASYITGAILNVSGGR
jgi:NAD(P)-dependent dehydrogenase (short-subunit alcohol dehydrogenase family)